MLKIFIIKTKKNKTKNFVQEIEGYCFHYENQLPSDAQQHSKWCFMKNYYQDNRVFSKDSKGNIVECESRLSSNNEIFLQTKNDGTVTDNLLNLPDC